MTHEITVTLRGPEYAVQTTWGERKDRDTLATLTVPVDAYRGWQIYQEAIRRAIEPTAILTLPPELTADEAEAIRRKWMEKHSGP